VIRFIVGTLTAEAILSRPATQWTA
jgi:hypothetical protein